MRKAMPLLMTTALILVAVLVAGCNESLQQKLEKNGWFVHKINNYDRYYLEFQDGYVYLNYNKYEYNPALSPNKETGMLLVKQTKDKYKVTYIDEGHIEVDGQVYGIIWQSSPSWRDKPGLGLVFDKLFLGISSYWDD